SSLAPWDHCVPAVSPASTMSVASQAAAANTPVSLNVTDLTTISITSITARRPPASYAQSNCPKCAASWRISKSSATGSISGSPCPWKGPKSCGRNRLNKPLKSVSARFQLGLPKKVKCTHRGREAHSFHLPDGVGHLGYAG